MLRIPQVVPSTDMGQLPRSRLSQTDELALEEGSRRNVPRGRLPVHFIGMTAWPSHHPLDVDDGFSCNHHKAMAVPT